MQTADIHVPMDMTSSFLPSDTQDDSASRTLRDVSSKFQLNKFLVSRDISPVRSCLATPWNEAGDRSKRYYIKKASQAVAESLKVIVPNDPDLLWQSLVGSQTINKQLSVSSSHDAYIHKDDALLESLAECYNEADQWETRRQILSIMVEKIDYSTLKRLIPDLTRYRYKIAKRHSLLHGKGVPVPSSSHTRMRVPQEKVEHFICFITSQHVISDLPFGEKKLTLSSKEIITVPNVIRMIVPERIVKQYLQFCNETHFSPLSRSSLLRILQVCSASVRTSLQGLDYITESGSKGFDDLEDVVDRLGDLRQDMSWAKQTKHQLKLAKRYLKGDFKVRINSNLRVIENPAAAHMHT